MNTLTGIEADRVNDILKHSIDKLQILSFVPTQWDDDVYAEVTCQPVLASLEKQWSSEENLNEILEVGGTTMDGGKELTAIKRCHKATRGTCRNLMADPKSLQVLMDRPETLGNEELLKFIKYLIELKSLVNVKLTTTVEDEAANRSLLHELAERERKMEESKDILQLKLNEVREEKDRVSFQLDQTLRKLQLELQDLTLQNSTELNTVQKEMSDAIAKSTFEHELRIKQLHEQIEASERIMTESIDKNNDEEMKLRKEKHKAEVALASKISSYDEDMLAKSNELDILNRNYKTEFDEYSRLKEYFDRIDANLHRIAEEEKILLAVKRRDDFGLFVVYRAAQKIQSIVRMKQGKAIVAKMKPKSKKSGGKKGKK